MQRGEADPALAQLGNHVHQVLKRAAVAIQARDDKGVTGLEEGVARLQLRTQCVLAGLLVREKAAALRLGEDGHLPVESLRSGADPGVPDPDLARVEREGTEEVIGGPERVSHRGHGRQCALK